MKSRFLRVRCASPELSDLDSRVLKCNGMKAQYSGEPGSPLGRRGQHRRKLSSKICYRKHVARPCFVQTIVATSAKYLFRAFSKGRLLSFDRPPTLRRGRELPEVGCLLLEKRRVQCARANHVSSAKT